MNGHPLIIGHRGAAGLAPENSLSGFARAIALGADGVECDIHLSADGVPIVIHDAALGRTTDATGPVAAMTAREIARVRILRDASAPPTLAQVAKLLEPSDLLLNLEIKTGARARRHAGIEAAAVRCLADARMLERTVVSSFDWNCVDEFLNHARPRLALGLLKRRSVVLAGGIARALGRASRRGLDGICVPADCLKGKRVKPADRARIWVYGANDAATIRAALDAGPAAIITDRPDLALTIRAG